MATTEKPDECDSCSFTTQELTIVEAPYADNPTAWFCNVCYGSLAGNAYLYPSQYDQGAVLRHVALCTNMVLQKLDQMKSGA